MSSQSLATGTVGTISLTWGDLPERERLGAMWRNLEARADASFFISWRWMAAWLAVLPPSVRPKLLVACQHGQVVGLGLLVAGWARRFKVLPVRCWYLHETGIPAIDSLTIEHNDFLLDRRYGTEVRQAMLAGLLKATGAQLRISGSTVHHETPSSTAAAGLKVHTVTKHAYVVDLAAARQAPGGYLSLLSSRRRMQIRQSLRRYEALGPLTLEAAPDLPTAHRYLNRLQALHSATWQQRGQRTAFTHEPVVQRFHAQLLDTGFAHGEVQLLRVLVGTQEVGYVYNFIRQGRVSFYQCGFQYGLLDKYDSPGYVVNALAIQANADLGHACYDFLAGSQHYKAHLATHTEPLHWCTLERRTLVTELESGLRDITRRMLAGVETAADQDTVPLSVN